MGSHTLLGPRAFQIQPFIQVGVHYLDSNSLIYQYSFHIVLPNPKYDHQSIVMGLDGSEFIIGRKAHD